MLVFKQSNLKIGANMPQFLTNHINPDF